MKNLKELGLGSNKIEDLFALSELFELTFLDLYSNNISDVTPLSSLIELNQLHLDDNPIFCTDIDKLRTFLTDTGIVAYDCIR